AGNLLWRRQCLGTCPFHFCYLGVKWFVGNDVSLCEVGDLACAVAQFQQHLVIELTESRARNAIRRWGAAETDGTARELQRPCVGMFKRDQEPAVVEMRVLRQVSCVVDACRGDARGL